MRKDTTDHSRKRPAIGGARGRAHTIVVFAAGVVVGTMLTLLPTARAVDVDTTYRKLQTFAQVLSYVQQNYVDDVDVTDLVYNAISGMLRELDPFTTFMRPEAYRKLREDTSGEFGGLGVELVEKGEHVAVSLVEDDAPAARAGIVVGDVIQRIDGERVNDFGVHEIAERLRGDPGSRVEVTVTRASPVEEITVVMVRRQIRVRSVDAKLLAEKFGYVRIRAFQDHTDIEVAQALVDLHRGAGGKISGLVIDLRDNAGGLFDEAVKTADRFLSTGIIVRTEGRNARNSEVESAHPLGTEPDYPIAILVNEGTASASEILAGALQDHRRAVLVGTKTYGKGSVQTLFGLDDESGLKLTVARYLTPSGRSIQETGIRPDVEVTLDADQDPVSDLTDPQVRSAVEHLKRPRSVAKSSR